MPWKLAGRAINLAKASMVVAASMFFPIIDNASSESMLPLLTKDPQQSSIDIPQPPCKYTASFKQERNFDELENPVVSTGRFLFSCNRGLLWEVHIPIPDTRVYTKARLNFRIKRNAEVTQLHNIAESHTANLLLNFLGGNTEALKKDFDLINDENAPDAVVLLPKKKAIRERLTQLILQQDNDTVRITLQAPATGDLIISINNIESFDQSERAACQQFSRQPRPNCSVLISPIEFVE